ncbi:hypothetical protein V6N11_017449 [Hibiscus sabdariffa]|uniref:Uncharacterized protein n=1 Tax=Hibiscus sabdariffa TaxID=183260 RepID=A0ABR2TYA4_9ROSI
MEDNNGESDWLSGKFIGFDDEVEELISVKKKCGLVKRKIKIKIICAEDLEPNVCLGPVEAYENEATLGGLGVAEPTENKAALCCLSATKATENEATLGGLGSTAIVKSAEENEYTLGDLSSGQDTEYLDSSNVGSYEINSVEDFIPKNVSKVFLCFKC